MVHLCLLWVLALALAGQAAASRHARASSPRPAFSYKQLTRADILRRAALKHSRQLAPRARVSNAAYDTCLYAGDNTNGIYSTVSGSVTDGYGSEVGERSSGAVVTQALCHPDHGRRRRGGRHQLERMPARMYCHFQYVKPARQSSVA